MADIALTGMTHSQSKYINTHIHTHTHTIVPRALALSHPHTHTHTNSLKITHTNTHTHTQKHCIYCCILHVSTDKRKYLQLYINFPGAHTVTF